MPCLTGSAVSARPKVFWYNTILYNSKTIRYVKPISRSMNVRYVRHLTEQQRALLARIIHQPKKPTEEDALGSRMMLKTAVSQEHHHPKTSASGCPDTVLTGLTVVIGHNTS